MKKYEYLEYKEKDFSTQLLNELGKQGWKLISVCKCGKSSVYNDYYFIRKAKKKKSRGYSGSI